jgi:L-ascorbate metabolism protein UlaG (beta-lactamase superfamily)
MFPHFIGKNPSGKNLERIKKSPHYKMEGFENLTETPMMIKGNSYFDLLKKVINKPADTKPFSPMPSVKAELKNSISDKPYIVWFGHSSYFIRMDNKTFLVDPVFSGHASPVSFMINSFKGSDVYSTDDLPEIDYLILTHDHYDHMDFETIMKLKSKVNSVYCSLGVSSHLIYWGYEGNIINEIDWWQTKKLTENITITAAPARHFSGRGLVRNKTFWSSFILQIASYNLFLGGDSGYDFHFKEIGEKFGPFDITILECGQYNSAWPYIHMMPEQTIQAAIDLKSNLLLPVHWGKFSLALHPWKEPIERAIAAASVQNLTITTPMIGEPVIVSEIYPGKRWWNF